MKWFGKAALAVMLLTGTTLFVSAPARADVAIGFSFGYGDGYFNDSCDYYDYYDAAPPWGLPPDYCEYPVYSDPVYWGGYWYRGPIYYRWYGGQRLFWLNGGWHHDEWRGPRPSIRWTDRGGWNRRGDWDHGGWNRGVGNWGRDWDRGRGDWGRADWERHDGDRGRGSWDRDGGHSDVHRGDVDRGNWNRGGAPQTNSVGWSGDRRGPSNNSAGWSGGGNRGPANSFGGGSRGWPGGDGMRGGSNGSHGGDFRGGGDHHGGRP